MSYTINEAKTEHQLDISIARNKALLTGDTTNLTNLARQAKKAGNDEMAEAMLLEVNKINAAILAEDDERAYQKEREDERLDAYFAPSEGNVY